MLDLVDKDIKAAIIKIVKKSKANMFKINKSMI